MNSRLAWLCLVGASFAGCSSWNVLDVRSQSPDEAESEGSDTRLVRDLAVPFGNDFPVEVEAVGLVTGLRGTGSDPSPSEERLALLDEMQTRGVKNPNAVLASESTALVKVRALLRPGIQEGDHFDVEVRVHSRSETTSLRGGYLLQTRLKEMALLNNQFHEGHLLALAEGPLLVDPSAEGKDDRVAMTRGRILGGGVALKSRPLALVLKPNHQNVFNSARVANAVNKRFHTFRNGIKVGVAKAIDDQHVRLIVHPTYRNNLERYVKVVRSVALRESATQRMQRIAGLKERLLDPVTAAEAALRLEAVGSEGAEALLAGIASEDPEVRFYAAESLAYLGRREAAEPLGQAARQEPAFRVYALTALSVMDEFAAHEQLRQLLEVPSAETRYGAFRALRTMNPDDPLVMGEQLGGQFSYHVLSTSGPPMIHVTRNRRPEIVLFGQDQRFQTPMAVDAGNQVMVTSRQPDQVTVSRFWPGEADQKRVVSTAVDEVIRAIVELGGTYPDVVQALQEAKATGSLPGRFEVEALPMAGRTYHRVARDEGERNAPARGDPQHADLSSARAGTKRGPAEAGKQTIADEIGKTGASGPDSGRKSTPGPGFFARIMGRDRN